MEKEILYEINRFREILGLPLLKESVGGGIIDEFLTLFGKSAEDFETFVKSDVNDIFIIKNFNNQPILTVSQSGVVVVATQSVELTGTAPNGAIYFTSGSFFVGLD